MTTRNTRPQVPALAPTSAYNKLSIVDKENFEGLGSNMMISSEIFSGRADINIELDSKISPALFYLGRET
jgi:hypothetical protein